ncbi:NlpC/P60 family protein [[Clostridium] scindens]|uniref:C40 family peptidase n=1 Tax=Clostridium scindens (strain JCM 10418 / VPI 12708) TaxID=29347 RepID=UPI001C703968|nr:C40 family peptidase [[Clostridium] scindens]QYX28535.1 C40 family peptidase [[Clostridium] scindens]
MKKFGTRLLTAVVASSMIVTPVFAAPSVDDLKENKAAKESEVSSLQEQLTDIMSKLGDLEESLIEKGEEITKAEEDLKEAQEKEQEQYEAMKKRIKFMYEEGDTTALETLVTAENFSDLVNKAEYVQNVHTYDRKQLEEYVETKQQIADLKTTLEDEQKNMESMQAEYEDKESELSSTIVSKKAEVADLDSQIQAAAEAAAAEALAAQQQAAANNNGNNNNNNSNRNNNSSGNNNHANNSNSASTGGGTGNTSTAQAIVNAAYGQLGVPYVWGGTTPGVGLDCSGLTQYCHRVAGISIGRTSEVQGGGGRAVSNPQPGDLVCYGSHIGIYIGGGQMIHAPHKGDVVRVANVYGSPWYRRYW